MKNNCFLLAAALLLTCCARASGSAPEAPCGDSGTPVVKVGIEVLESRGFEGLAGKKVGLVLGEEEFRKQDGSIGVTLRVTDFVSVFFLPFTVFVTL